MRGIHLYLILFTFITLKTFGAQLPDSTYIQMAESARMKKNFDKEIAILLDGDSANPQSSEILWRLARSYAEKASKVILSNDSHGLPFKKEFYNQALNYAKKAEEADPYSPQGYYYHAIAMGGYIQYGTYKEMIKGSAIVKHNIEQAIALNKTHHRAMHVLGRWHYEVARLSSFVKFMANVFYSEIPKGSFEEAAQNFRRALEVKSLDVHRLWLAKSYIQLDKKDSARIELKKVISAPIIEMNDSLHKEEAKSLLENLN